MNGQQHEPDDWDRIEQWTARVWRWMLVGIPTWLILLALLDERWSGIPLAFGFVMASVLALAVVIADDLRRRRGASRGGLTPFGRVLMTWIGAFLVFAFVIGSSDRSGAALVLVPFLGATLIAGLVEFGRRAMRRP